MKIRGFKFGHPVFGVYDYYDFGPNFSPNFKINNNELIVSQNSFNFGSNVKLIELMNNGEATFIAEIFCTYTMYRKCFRLNEDFIIKIPLTQLKNQVECLFLVVSNKEFEYYNDAVRGDLKDEGYFIEEGDVLAFLGEYKFPLDIRGANVESFLKIRKKENDEPGVNYIYVERSIIIEIGEKDFTAIQQFSHNLDYQKILIAGLLQPALIHACYFMKEKEYSEKEWFRTLLYRWQIYNKSKNLPIPEEAPTHLDIPGFVDSILKDPLNQLIGTLFQIEKESMSEEVY